jgi:hypothetical protein
MPECREEAGPQLHTYGENEENKAELFDEREGMVIDRFTEMTAHNSGKKNAGSAETDSAKFESAEQHSKDANE